MHARIRVAMMRKNHGFDRRSLLKKALLTVGLVTALGASAVQAKVRPELEADASAALKELYATAPKARELGAKSRAVLVFPKIVKAGLMIGGQTGDGVLFEKGKPTRYYRISAASFGFQVGGQKFGYALFLVTPSAIAALDKNDGWAVGSGPSIVLVDKGLARSMNTTTLKKDVYAMAFGQKGLMAGAGIEGSKITRIDGP